MAALGASDDVVATHTDSAPSLAFAALLGLSSFDRANAARAGVRIRVEQGRVEDMERSLGGRVLVTNPPYGVRLGGDTASIARALAALRGGRVGVITPDPAFSSAVRPRPTRRHEVMNGDIACVFDVFEL